MSRKPPLPTATIMWPHRTFQSAHPHRLCVFHSIVLCLLLPNVLVPLSYTVVRCDPLPMSSSISSYNSQSSINFRCPEQFGYYADEYNCSKYFVCVFGEALHESCTGGLRFSSELQTCDWPRNVVCPSEDSGYDNGDEDSSFEPNQALQLDKPGVDSTTATISDGYVKEIHHTRTVPPYKVTLSDGTSQPGQHFTSTVAPSFTTEFSLERINEAVLQESFDKLVKSHQQRQHKLTNVKRPSLKFDLNKSNVTDINYITLSKDLHSNKLDTNGTHDDDLGEEDLVENFTLVDLQRSPINLANNNSFLRESHNQTFHNNILGTIGEYQFDNKANSFLSVLLGRSVNGENSAQSVSVVASTSSEVMIPELDFMFNKHLKDNEQKSRNNLKSVNNHKSNRLELNNLFRLNDFKEDTGSNTGQNDNFNEAIAAILNENGAIHIDEHDGSTLLRILTPLEKKNYPNENPLPGTAASNRNFASQQVVVKKDFPSDTSNVDDKHLYQTSHSKRQNNDQIVSSHYGNERVRTMKPNSNTILVYNRTQLIPIPNNSATKNGTFILIDHQQPKVPLGDNRKSTLMDYNPDFNDLKLKHRARQSLTRVEPPRVLNFSHNQTNKASGRVRLKPLNNQKSTYSSADEGIDDEEMIDILVDMQSPSSDIEDFQRIHKNQSNSSLKNNIPSRESVQYTSDNRNLNSSRVSQGRHIGSYHRASKSMHHSNGTIRSNHSHRNASLQIPSRPMTLYETPVPLSIATKCSEELCRLPDCFCGDTKVPGGLPVNEIPQLVLISFDDAVNDINWHIYEELLNSGRSNPNGCPIKATFYVSHEWTDYSQVQTLYSRGHEIASHSITHSFGESFTKQQWFKEISGQREILHLYGGVNLADIRGMRAPFLQGGGNKQFEMLHENNFTYDSSMPVFENSPPFWPYTFDYSINHECMIAPCPTKSFPGLWEIGLVMWQDLRGGRCSMGDACSNPSDENGVYELIMNNFKRHYHSNRAPFGLYYHSAWFNNEHHRKGFIRVIDDLLTYYKDVYFVTKWELIQWIRNPTALKELYRVNQFGCARDPTRPPPCLHPNICNVGSHSNSRFLKTCQPCPKRYPWLGDTGQ